MTPDVLILQEIGISIVFFCNIWCLNSLIVILLWTSDVLLSYWCSYYYIFSWDSMFNILFNFLIPEFLLFNSYKQTTQTTHTTHSQITIRLCTNYKVSLLKIYTLNCKADCELFEFYFYATVYRIW